MRRALAFALLLLVWTLPGCAAPRSGQVINLSPAPAAVSVFAETNPETKPIRIAAVSVLSPQETARHYGLFFAYLEKKLGRPIELVQRKTYEENYELLRYGSLDVAMICTYVYVLGSKEFGLQLLAGPQVNGKAEYQSFIITRVDSGIERFTDLAGKRFAFTDPLSTSGRVYPLGRLRSMGHEPGRFFASTTYTYSHDNSIKAVAQGVVDAAAVDSLVYDQWMVKSPDLALKLRVIERSDPLPSPPFVVSPRLDPQIRRQIQDILLEMDADHEGKEILAALNIERWVLQTDEAYGTVRKLAQLAGMDK